MPTGQVVSIHIAPAAAEPLMAVETVRAVPGKGLEGDRYFTQTGTFSKPSPDCEVTLIETEALQWLQQHQGISLAPGANRRNIVTHGIALNDLVDREFRIGAVTLRGIRLCEPCAHLEKLTRPGVVPGLTHRGGLRAQILVEGVIHIGDAIEEMSRP